MTHVKNSLWSLEAIEQHTGLSRDVLRKWELRYKFPQPLRGKRGERQYSTQDADKLKLISRLIQKGLRVGRLVQQSHIQLQNLLDSPSVSLAASTPPPKAEVALAVSSLLQTLRKARGADEVSFFLQAQLKHHGLARFVACLMPAFNHAVGQAWQNQRLGIALEHLYTQSLRQMVLRALPIPGQAHALPRVLLTTPPGEQHSLGLLALHAGLSLQGANCIDLDTQTPLTEVVHMAQTMAVGVVAISVSASLPVAQAQAYLRELRDALPPTCVLWLGGQGTADLVMDELPQCTRFTDTTSAVQCWLALAQACRKVK